MYDLGLAEALILRQQRPGSCRSSLTGVLFLALRHYQRIFSVSIDFKVHTARLVRRNPLSQMSRSSILHLSDRAITH